MNTHKGDRSFLPEHSQDLSCTNSPRRTFSSDVWSGYKHNVCSRRVVHPISSVSDADFDDSDEVNISNRNTIEDFTEEIDEARFVRQYNFFHLLMCLPVMNLLLIVPPPSSSFVTMAVSIPHWVLKSDRLSPDEDSLREDYYYEAIANWSSMRRP